MEDMCLDRERLESKMKPKLRAKGTGVRKVLGEMKRFGFWILVSCVGRPISRNSVFDGLRERKLDDIQVEMSDIVFCRSSILCAKLLAEKEMKS
jgi:hypothetical protein